MAPGIPELKPCPFCGEATGARWMRDRNCYVACANCGAEGPPRPTYDEAEAAWNERQGEPQAGAGRREYLLTIDTDGEAAIIGPYEGGQFGATPFVADAARRAGQLVFRLYATSSSVAVGIAE